MTGFSIWHWLIVFLIFLAPIGVAAVVIRSKKKANPMGRKSFSIRILGLMAFYSIVEFMLPPEPWAIGVALLIAIVEVAFIAYWAVDRFHDLGASKNKALLAAVPLLGSVVIVYLMVRKRPDGA